jgi:hypothetical protein
VSFAAESVIDEGDVEIELAGVFRLELSGLEFLQAIVKTVSAQLEVRESAIVQFQGSDDRFGRW